MVLPILLKVRLNYHLKLGACLYCCFYNILESVFLLDDNDDEFIVIPQQQSLFNPAKTK